MIINILEVLYISQDTVDEKINALVVKTGDVDKKLISGLEVVDSTVVNTSGNESISKE